MNEYSLEVTENHRLRMLLEQERGLHAETSCKLQKADHDRKRYAKRIRFIQAQHEVLAREFHALKKERDILQTALTSCEKY